MSFLHTGEPLFAGSAAVWLGGEVLGPRVLLSGALIITAVHLVEVAPRRRRIPQVDMVLTHRPPALATPTAPRLPTQRTAPRGTAVSLGGL